MNPLKRPVTIVFDDENMIDEQSHTFISTSRTLDHSAILHFADVLEKIPSNNWDFSLVGHRRGPPFTSLGEVFHTLDKLTPNCGAVGCAVGHAGAAFDGLSGHSEQRKWDLIDLLGMPEEDFRSIFGYKWQNNLEAYQNREHSQVTALDVAKALRRYSEEGSWWR